MKFLQLAMTILILITSHHVFADVYGTHTLEEQGTSFVKVIPFNHKSSKVKFSFCENKESVCEPIGRGEYSLEKIEELRSQLTKTAHLKRAGKVGAIIGGGIVVALVAVTVAFPPSAVGTSSLAISIMGLFDTIGVVVVGALGLGVGSTASAIAWKVSDLPSGPEFYYARDLIKKRILVGGDVIVAGMTSEEYAEELSAILGKIDARAE